MLFITCAVQGLQKGILQCYPTVPCMAVLQDIGLSWKYFSHVLQIGDQQKDKLKKVNVLQNKIYTVPSTSIGSLIH